MLLCGTRESGLFARRCGEYFLVHYGNQSPNQLFKKESVQSIVEIRAAPAVPERYM